MCASSISPCPCKYLTAHLRALQSVPSRRLQWESAESVVVYLLSVAVCQRSSHGYVELASALQRFRSYMSSFSSTFSDRRHGMFRLRTASNLTLRNYPPCFDFRPLLGMAFTSRQTSTLFELSKPSQPTLATPTNLLLSLAIQPQVVQPPPARCPRQDVPKREQAERVLFVMAGLSVGASPPHLHSVSASH